MQRALDIVLIAAMDRNRVIGKDGQLPWHLPDDLKRFKFLTSGKTILMGRKTAESLGRALPNRRNLVLTRSRQVPFAGMETVNSLSEACSLASGELMVIGGGEIYRLCLPLATAMQLTLIDCAVENAEVFFPAFNWNDWQQLSRVGHDADTWHQYAFEFVDLKRILP